MINLPKPLSPAVTNDESQNAADNDTGILKYVIAGSVIAACIGNMFVARKMRSFSNIKNPVHSTSGFSSQSKSSSTNSSTSSSANNSANSTYAGNCVRMKMEAIELDTKSRNLKMFCDWRTSNFDPSYKSRPPISLLPQHLHSNLDHLQLLKQFPSRKEVKDGYRRLALLIHPDRIRNSYATSGINTSSSSSNSCNSSIDFNKATEDYDELLSYLDKLDESTKSSSPKSSR